ncbi:hypothetical protein Tco_0940380 [Tanacetum coccineum]|uniref:Uncharacterized protein n=1 Tax=Tanacetum coccineum TaxID=301880 RepID=A0ABQ5DMV2_9ASTR
MLSLKYDLMLAHLVQDKDVTGFSYDFALGIYTMFYRSVKGANFSPSSSTQENERRVDEVKKALGPLLDKAKEVFGPISSWDFEEVEEAFGPISDDTKQAFSPVSSSTRSMENGAVVASVQPRFPQSEAEQESRTGITYGGTSGSIRASSSTGKLPILGVKSFDRRSAHPSRHPSVGSSFDSQVSNWEDGISTSSLSEAEEKTIKAVYEQMKERDNSRKDTTSSEIYETVRSEVRRAIADIQDDLQDRNKDPGHVTSRSTAQDIYKNDTKVV